MPRNVEQFSGRSLIFCGGWSQSCCIEKPAIRTPGVFFTVDILAEQEPDLVADICNPSDLTGLPRDHFDFIYFEYAPPLTDLPTAFRLAYDLLRRGGVIIYHGNDGYDHTIPELLLRAGFDDSCKKSLDPSNHKNWQDRGRVSIAAKGFTLNDQEKIALLPEEARYYIEHEYFFFMPDRLLFPPLTNDFLLLLQILNTRARVPTYIDNQPAAVPASSKRGFT